MVEISESAKPPTFALPRAARTHHAWLARLTRARRTRFGRRTARVLLADFWYTPSRRRRSEVASPPRTLLLVIQKYDKRKVTLCFFSFRVLFACPKRTKRTKRGMLSSFEHLLSPRGDRCEHTSPTVRQLLNHGYRFETLKRRLGFAAVPCQAMANLAVQIWVRVCVRT